MEAIKHSPEFAKKAGVPQSVGRDFANADKKEGKYRTKARHAERRRKETNKWAMNRKSNVGEYST